MEKWKFLVGHIRECKRLERNWAELNSGFPIFFNFFQFFFNFFLLGGKRGLWRALEPSEISFPTGSWRVVGARCNLNSGKIKPQEYQSKRAKNEVLVSSFFD